MIFTICDILLLLSIVFGRPGGFITMLKFMNVYAPKLHREIIEEKRPLPCVSRLQRRY